MHNFLNGILTELAKVFSPLFWQILMKDVFEIKSGEDVFSSQEAKPNSSQQEDVHGLPGKPLQHSSAKRIWINRQFGVTTNCKVMPHLLFGQQFAHCSLVNPKGQESNISSVVLKCTEKTDRTTFSN